LPEELPVNFSRRTVSHGVGERGRVDKDVIREDWVGDPHQIQLILTGVLRITRIL